MKSQNTADNRLRTPGAVATKQSKNRRDMRRGFGLVNFPGVKDALRRSRLAEVIRRSAQTRVHNLRADPKPLATGKLRIRCGGATTSSHPGEKKRGRPMQGDD